MVTFTIKAIAALAVSGMIAGASAGSIGFDALEYDGSLGEVFVTVNYDFTDLDMYGGGLDLIYDPNADGWAGAARSHRPGGLRCPPCAAHHNSGRTSHWGRTTAGY